MSFVSYERGTKEDWMADKDVHLELLNSLREVQSKAVLELGAVGGSLGDGHWELCLRDFECLRDGRKADGTLLVPELHVGMSFLGLPVTWCLQLRARQSQLVINASEFTMTTVYPGPPLTRVDHGPDGPERM